MLSKTMAHLWRAFLFTLDGLKLAYQTEFAFRLECYVSLVAIPLALLLGQGASAKAMLIGSWLLVPIIELLNSAIEAAIDRIGKEHHELSKNAKDLGSAAVFLACANAAILWLILIFID